MLLTLPSSSSLRTRIAYALPGVPLAFFALPVYVHVPQLYAGALGLPLAGVGVVMLLARLFDAVSDPLLGRLSDQGASRRTLMLLAAPLLLLGWCLLFLPPAAVGLAWLGMGLVVAYAGYSLAVINYQAWGAEYPVDEAGRLQASAWREGASLLGVMLAAVLPGVFSDDLPQGLLAVSAVWIPLLLLALWMLLHHVPLPRVVPPLPREAISFWQMFHAPLFRRLLAIYAVNGVAAAVPATLVLFYVSDVLAAPTWGGLFLLLYFSAGACGMPLWVALARRQGCARTWQQGMVLAMLCFACTPFLGAGDGLWFALICVGSGIALGADLVLPPTLLSEHIARHGQAGASFGWWTAVSKLSLALAAGTALPLLAVLGYMPGTLQPAGGVLAWVYGGLPLLLKAAALFMLHRSTPSLSVLNERETPCVVC